MPAADRAKIQKECLKNGAEETVERRGTAGFGPQSAATAGIPGGGGGGGLGASSGATLDPDLNGIRHLGESAVGQRDAFGNMRVDSSGGYSGSGGGPGGDSTSENSFNAIANAPDESPARSIASQNEGRPRPMQRMSTIALGKVCLVYRVRFCANAAIKDVCCTAGLNRNS